MGSTRPSPYTSAVSVRRHHARRGRGAVPPAPEKKLTQAPSASSTNAELTPSAPHPSAVLGTIRPPPPFSARTMAPTLDAIDAAEWPAAPSVRQAAAAHANALRPSTRQPIT